MNNFTIIEDEQRVARENYVDVLDVQINDKGEFKYIVQKGYVHYEPQYIPTLEPLIIGVDGLPF